MPKSGRQESCNTRCVSDIYLQWGAGSAPHNDIHLGDDSVKGSHDITAHKLSGGQADRQTRGWGEALATASDDEVLHLLGLLPGILPWGEGLDPWRLAWMMDGRLGVRLLERMGSNN